MSPVLLPVSLETLLHCWEFSDLFICFWHMQKPTVKTKGENQPEASQVMK